MTLLNESIDCPSQRTAIDPTLYRCHWATRKNSVSPESISVMRAPATLVRSCVVICMPRMFHIAVYRRPDRLFVPLFLYRPAKLDLSEKRQRRHLVRCGTDRMAFVYPPLIHRHPSASSITAPNALVSPNGVQRCPERSFCTVLYDLPVRCDRRTHRT